MTKLAKANQSAKAAELQAQALNCKALVQMRRGIKAAVKSAAAAVRTKHTSQSILALSYYRLSEAQFRTVQFDRAVENAKNRDLYLSIGDLSGAGRSSWALSNSIDQQAHLEKSRRAGQTALELCRQAGDQYGRGNALSALTFTDVDMAERIQHIQQAADAFEKAGFVDRKLMAAGNLAFTYQDLGLYHHAYRLHREVVESMRSIGIRQGLAYELTNLAYVETMLGRLEAANPTWKNVQDWLGHSASPIWMQVSIRPGRTYPSPRGISRPPYAGTCLPCGCAVNMGWDWRSWHLASWGKFIFWTMSFRRP